MNKLIFYFVMFVSAICYGQKNKTPFAFVYEGDVASDFSRMTNISKSGGFGYEFSEKLRAGISVPLYVMFLEAEGKKNISFSGGLGLNVNFRDYKDEKITLRTHLECSVDENSTNFDDWTFIKFSVGEQIYINKFCTETVQPFIGIGYRYYRGFVTSDTDQSFRIHNFHMPYIHIGAVINY